MNSEEKDLNPESDVEVFSLDSTNGIVLDKQDNVEDSFVDTNSISNVFMYTDSSISPTEELSVDSTPSFDNLANTFDYKQDIAPTVENAFVYTDAPLGANTPTVEYSENQFSYTDLKDMPQDTVEETLTHTPQSQTSNVSNYGEENPVDSKSNFKFMLVFAIIMLAIIIALPYIAGYK